MRAEAGRRHTSNPSSNRHRYAVESPPKRQRRAMETLVVGDLHLKQPVVLPRVDSLLAAHPAVGRVVFPGDTGPLQTRWRRRRFRTSHQNASCQKTYTFVCVLPLKEAAETTKPLPLRPIEEGRGARYERMRYSMMPRSKARMRTTATRSRATSSPGASTLPDGVS